MLLIIISIGTASTVPQAPHIHVQNSKPTKIATGFICAARLRSAGVSRNPSRPVMKRAAPATYDVRTSR